MYVLFESILGFIICCTIYSGVKSVHKRKDGSSK